MSATRLKRLISAHVALVLGEDSDQRFCDCNMGLTESPKDTDVAENGKEIHMGKLRNSIFLKTIAFIVHQICFVIMAITVFIGITYWNYDDASFDIIEQDDFTKTNYYKRLVEDNIYDLITYINYCDKFQTNGEIDLSRIVDIYDYVQNDRITGDTTISFGYRAEELLWWQEEGFQYRSNVDNSLYEYQDNSVEQTDYHMEELYSNTAGMSLRDYAAAKQLDYRDVYEMVEKAAAKLTEEYAQYKTQVSLFKANNTNLRYAVYNGELDQLYTNIDVTGIKTGLEQIKNMETYVILDSTTAEFTSNIFYANDQLNHYLNTLYINDEEYILAVGVDTSFPVLDSFHKEQLRYDNFEDWFQVLYKLLIVSVAGYIICFFYLSLAAGHKKGSEQPALIFFDKLKTELLAVLFIGGEGYLAYVILRMLNGLSLLSINPVTIILVGIMALCIGLLFTICYLSFLRRVKAGTLWENSLLYTIVKAWNGLRHNRRLLVRVCLFYGVILAGCIFVGWQRGDYLEMVICFGVFMIIGYFYVSDRLERQKIIDGCRNIANGDLDFQIETKHFYAGNKLLGDTVNQIKFVLREALEDRIKNERLKTNLITNVSHDIKTPLTSIINYVSLLKNISLDNEKANEYIQILDDKSQRLKHLTEDLVEASKISSGNITLEKTRLNLVELIKQTSGEFCERYEEKNLTLVTSLPQEAVYVEADGRRIWRILENIYNNALKYSLVNSRVYANLITTEESALFTLKNVSAQPLNVDAEELTKRFVRGDESRTTEGSGLGLSIARDLTQLHGGTLEITVDGDLFCVTVTLPLKEND